MINRFILGHHKVVDSSAGMSYHLTLHNRTPISVFFSFSSPLSHLTNCNMPILKKNLLCEKIFISLLFIRHIMCTDLHLVSRTHWPYLQLISSRGVQSSAQLWHGCSPLSCLLKMMRGQENLLAFQSRGCFNHLIFQHDTLLRVCIPSETK